MMKKFNQIDFCGKKLNCYRASFHNHTTNSDGKMTPDELIASYATEGYDILSISDHHFITKSSEFDSKGMTMLPSVELHPAGPRNIGYHFLCLNLPENFTWNYNNGAQKIIDDVNKAGGVVFFAHPYWSGFTYNEVIALKGIKGIEVYNSTCSDIARENSVQLWDETLDFGSCYYAIGVDDTHKPVDLFGGWTMILAENCSPKSVIEALKNGNFYATCGPEFSKIEISKAGILSAEFSPCVRVNVISNRSNGRPILMPKAGEMTEITEFQHDFSWLHDNFASLPPEEHDRIYLRIQITDSNGKSAWSNPIFWKDVIQK